MATASTDLVSLANAKSYLGITGTDDDVLLNALIDRVSQAIETQTGRIFGYETITKELLNGNGATRLRLRYFPARSIYRLSIGRVKALDVTNVAATSAALHAYVHVSVAGALSLILAGGANEGTDTLTLSDYATIDDVATAINAIGKGWSASADDAAAGYPADDLIQTRGRLYALDETVNLDAPAEPETDYRLDDDACGIIYYSAGFTVGLRNIVVDYLAGYQSVPDDIAHAACLWVASLYNRAKAGADGFRSEDIPQLAQSFAHGCPQEARDIINSYREVLA